MDMKMTRAELALLQSLPLEDKIRKSELRIMEWQRQFGRYTYLAFSGGKDSTVLLHIIRRKWPEIPVVFCDTGLEYPEIRDFVRSTPNVEVIRPKMSFKDVLEKYGYPVISKETARIIYDIRNTKSAALLDTRLNGHYLHDGRFSKLGKLPDKWKFMLDAPFKISDSCCTALKKRPFSTYGKLHDNNNKFTAEMASDSFRRRLLYLQYGCNAFNTTSPTSRPLGFWTEQDILQYLKTYNVSYCKVYGDIKERERMACI